MRVVDIKGVGRNLDQNVARLLIRVKSPIPLDPFLQKTLQPHHHTPFYVMPLPYIPGALCNQDSIKRIPTCFLNTFVKYLESPYPTLSAIWFSLRLLLFRYCFALSILIFVIY